MGFVFVGGWRMGEERHVRYPPPQKNTVWLWAGDGGMAYILGKRGPVKGGKGGRGEVLRDAAVGHGRTGGWLRNVK